MAYTISWTEPGTDVVGYRIQRSTDEISWFTVAEVESGTSFYQDTTAPLPPGDETYYYRVLTICVGCDSDWVQVTTEGLT
jgi:hypothetical protein